MKHTARIALAVLALSLLVCGSALAHAISVWAEVHADGKVYVEGYTSDGKAVQDSKIVVKDADGKVVAEGKTDGEGKYSFTPPGKVPLTIELLPGLGHRGVFELTAEDYKVADEPVDAPASPASPDTAD